MTKEKMRHLLEQQFMLLSDVSSDSVDEEDLVKLSHAMVELAPLLLLMPLLEDGKEENEKDEDEEDLDAVLEEALKATLEAVKKHRNS